MRLHTLTVQAFGPFAQQTDVDFDALSNAGLFLLTGPTGAGKTFLLDAVTFALYGKVPGARSATTRLRSDHAPANVAPEVIVEFTADNRRMKVTRSPEWERPKKRGGGTTKEKSHVVLQELVDGSWKGLSTRHPECNASIQEALGLTAEQFTRVVLLPQGDFAAFLRADEVERKSLLESLFGTGDFKGVVTWLRSHATALGRSVDEQQAKVDAAIEQTNDLYDRIELQRSKHVAAHGGAENTSGFPQGAEENHQDEDRDTSHKRDAGGADPDLAAESGVTEEEAVDGATETTAADVDPVATAHNQLAAARHFLSKLVSFVEHHERIKERARQRLAAVTETRRTVNELYDATLTRESLDDVAEEVAAQKVQAQRAEDAAPVRQQDQQLAELTQRQQAYKQTFDQAREQWESHSVDDNWGPAADASFSQWLTDARNAVARFTTQVVLDEEVAQLRTAWQRASSTVDEAAARQSKADAAAENAEAEVKRAGEVIAARQPHADKCDALQRELQECTALAEAAREVDSATLKESQAATVLAQAEAAVAERRHRVAELRAQRLAGYAAELAANLEAGEPCVVCGSVEHPSLAVPADDSVTAADEDAAQADEQSALATLNRATQDHSAALAALQEKRERAGGVTTEQANELVAQKRAEAQRAQAAARAVDEASQQKDRAQAAADEAAEQSRAAVIELTAARTTVTEKTEQLRELTSRLEQARGGFPTVTERLAAAHEAQRILRVVQEAEVALQQMTVRCDEQRELVDALALQHGFASTNAAREASLPPDQLQALRSRLRKYDADRAVAVDRIASTLSVLREDAAAPSLLGGPVTSDPTAEQLQVWKTTLEASYQEHQAEYSRCDDAVTRARDAHAGLEANVVSLESAVNRLRSAFDAVAKKLTDYRRADDLARLASGTGGDNELGMGIESFILAARLEHITAAANSRLERMSGSRYSLVHSDAKAKRQRRAGLGIQVFDEWTSQYRDTASLSGGESFIASLALALGLADVVLAESGGRQLDMLFVDEGFGTLDSETLDEVLEVMDSLRRGGRAVGIISHVSEVKNRVSTQVQVRKTKKGSTLQTTAGY